MKETIERTRTRNNDGKDDNEWVESFEYIQYSSITTSSDDWKGKNEGKWKINEEDCLWVSFNVFHYWHSFIDPNHLEWVWRKQKRKVWIDELISWPQPTIESTLHSSTNRMEAKRVWMTVATQPNTTELLMAPLHLVPLCWLVGWCWNEQPPMQPTSFISLQLD